MVAPLDPLRGPAVPPQAGGARPAQGPADAFELEFQRLLQNDAPRSNTPPAPNPLLADDLTAPLEGVSESLKRATAYINSARAYFKGAPGAPPPNPGLDTSS